MKKKTLIGIAVSVLAMSYMAAIIPTAISHSHHAKEAHAGGSHEHDGIVFDQVWTSSNSLPSEAGNYYLGTDITLTSSQQINGDVSLCLNGHKILWGGATEGFLPTMLFVYGHNFNLCDCGTTEHKAVWDENEEYLVVDDTADEKDVVTTFTGGYIACHHDEVFSVKESNFNIYGGTLIGNGRQEEYGGDSVINILQETDFRMYGGNFLGNYGGAIKTWNSEQRNTVEFHGGRFSYNKVGKDDNGGAISCGMLAEGSPLILENIELSYNKAGNGGALFSSSSIIMKEGTNVHHNSAVYSGGGFELISADDGTNFSILGGTFSDNYATQSGGAIEYTSFSGYEGPKRHSSLNMSGGVISNNEAHAGGGIFAYTASEHPVAFNMTGGEISNNTAYSEEKVYHSEEYGDIKYYNYGYGGGVHFGSGTEQFENVFRLSGGEIKNNNAGKGGGVYAGSNTNVEVFGNPTVTGNKNIDNKADEINLYLREEWDNPDYVEPKIEIPSALDENAHLGIRLDKPTVFTKGLTDGDAYASNFYSCDDTYAVFVNDDEQLYLDLAHTHDWSYQANGNKITAACGASDCPVTEGLTLELEAPTSLTYDGTAKAATFKTGYSAAAFPNPQIKYYKNNIEVTECVNAGTYKAKVTFGTATAEVEFTIAKADSHPSEVSDRNAVYGQSLSEIALPDGWTWNSPNDKVGNVGTNQHKATYTPEDTDNYNTVEQNVNVIVAKADPAYTVPTDLKVLHDKTLSTVVLPTGWSWDNPDQNVGSELGNKVFKGTFTPEDTHNYNIVEHVDITVQIVDHEHNWSYTASGATITASCSSAECPVTSGLTLTLVAPSGDMVYDGQAREAHFMLGYSSEAFPNPQIKYYKGTEEVASCVKVGEYTAKVTFGNATAQVTFEILGKTIVDPDNTEISVEIDDVALDPDTDIELRVEIRTDVAEKDITEDYAKIQQMLEKNEKISKVYDVKLIQIKDGVETEIQPSDIQEGLAITVRMAIPEGIDITNCRILHIHSVDDMEFLTDYTIEGTDLVFKITKLSQFAFITKTAKSPAPLWVIPVSIVGGLLALCLICFLLLFFVFAKYIIVKDEDGDSNIVKAVKYGKEKQNDKEFLKLKTFKFKTELRVEEEVFDKKKDAEDFLRNKGQEEPKE